MGDRSQVCIKDGSSKVYLYGHWSGVAIYGAAARAVREVPGRHSDGEYFARAVFVRMIPADQLTDETAEKPGYTLPDIVSFAQFAQKQAAGEYDEL